MASSGKKKTTMAKMNRENKIRERRAEKQAKKDQKKFEPAVHAGVDDDQLLRDPVTGRMLPSAAVTGDPLAGEHEADTDR
ncbi:MAG: hypothetical protein QOF26_3111 [Baekduia sp.]|jgi:hypothetical protein|nr:hypothetical protein [Baekduia sp.]MDX6702885.1 hypothetical protein [Baekduia sp.]